MRTIRSGAVIRASVTDYSAVWARDHLRKSLGWVAPHVAGAARQAAVA